jgi:dsRNA-specific ribonuclease
MTERTDKIMAALWEDAKNTNEEKFVSTIILSVIEEVTHYNAQNNKIVLDKDDLIKLAQEFVDTSQTGTPES